MTRQVLVNATAVLPDRVLPQATIVAEDGLIVEVADRAVAPVSGVDVRGALVLPGLVDTHSDGLERELRPRPGAEVHQDFAVASYEGRVRAAGVTTMYHGIGYQNDGRKERDLQQARTLEKALGDRMATGGALVDHRLLLRLDARDPAALEALGSAVDRLYDPADALPLVSFEDHTPGQGQYANPDYFRKYMQETGGLSDAEAQRRISDLLVDRESRKEHRETAMRWLSEQARAGRIRLLAHDPVSAEEIAIAHAKGVAVAEFPTTMEAARAAREHGLPVVAGAPNVLRGRSHSGNVSATELIAAGLVDGLASDYMPSTLLAAVLRLAESAVVSLPQAIRLVTAGSAAVVGLNDRGALVPGLRSDLTVVTVAGGWPTVRLVLLADEQREDSPQPQLIHAAVGAR